MDGNQKKQSEIDQLQSRIEGVSKNLDLLYEDYANLKESIVDWVSKEFEDELKIYDNQN